MLKTDSNKLKRRIDSTLHSRRDFEYAKVIYGFPEYFNDIDRAWAVWIISKQAFASKLDGSFGYDKTSNSISKKIANSKHQFTQILSERLENTQIECTDAINIILSRDCVDAFHFVDPPYFNSNCGHYGGYTAENFNSLLDVLVGINGKFMLTMFPDSTLADYANRHNWRVVKITRNISASRVNRRKQEEWIVMNY